MMQADDAHSKVYVKILNGEEYAFVFSNKDHVESLQESLKAILNLDCIDVALFTEDGVRLEAGLLKDNGCVNGTRLQGFVLDALQKRLLELKDYRDVQELIAKLRADGRVLSITESARAMAVMKVDGGIVAWGDPSSGGDCRRVQTQLANDVQSIYATKHAFAALKTGGSVVVWGNEDYGGDCRPYIQQQLANNVQTLCSTTSPLGGAFAALKVDGCVVAWGYTDLGGDCSKVQDQIAGGVESIYSNVAAFAALKAGGSVIAWGYAHCGGDTSKVREQLTSDVQSIYASNAAFAALKVNGGVVAWGHADCGGDCSDFLELNDGVASITATKQGFKAVKNDGSLVKWGSD